MPAAACVIDAAIPEPAPTRRLLAELRDIDGGGARTLVGEDGRSCSGIGLRQAHRGRISSTTSTDWMPQAAERRRYVRERRLQIDQLAGERNGERWQQGEASVGVRRRFELRRASRHHGLWGAQRREAY